MTTTTIATETRILTRTTFTASDFEGADEDTPEAVLTMDDEGAGNLVFSYGYGSVQINTEDLDEVLKMLTAAVAVRDQLRPNGDTEVLHA